MQSVNLPVGVAADCDIFTQYILTMVLSEPSQFKWAALASYISIIAGGVTYLAYVKKERGHVWHHPAGDMFPLIRRKIT